MKLLEEKGLREKIINECIKYENEITERAWWENKIAESTPIVAKKLEHLYKVEINNYIQRAVSDLRFNLMQLLDNEKVE